MLAAAPIIFLVTFFQGFLGFQEIEACSLLVSLRKGMQSSNKQPLVGEEHCVTTLITAAKKTTSGKDFHPNFYVSQNPFRFGGQGDRSLSPPISHGKVL